MEEKLLDLDEIEKRLRRGPLPITTTGDKLRYCDVLQLIEENRRFRDMIQRMSASHRQPPFAPEAISNKQYVESVEAELKRRGLSPRVPMQTYLPSPGITD